VNLVFPENHFSIWDGGWDVGEGNDRSFDRSRIFNGACSRGTHGTCASFLTQHNVTDYILDTEPPPLTHRLSLLRHKSTHEVVDMAGLQSLVSLIYHEKQQSGSMLCAQHALNNLLRAYLHVSNIS